MRTIRSVIFFLLLSGAFSIVCCGQGVITQDLSNRIEYLGQKDKVRVIIKFTDRLDTKNLRRRGRKSFRRHLNTSLRSRANLSQRQVRKFLQNNTERKVKPLWIVNALAAEIPAGLIETLSLYPQVESIEFDILVTSAINPPAIDAGASWNISAIGADTLWNLGYTGSGVVVASMDTGVDGAHPDLISTWRGGSNSWFDPHNQYSFPTDTDGHGTQTMGVILASQAIGVAPSANWIAVKIFDDTGSSAISDIHAGFQWLMDPDDDPNTDDAPDIVNNS